MERFWMVWRAVGIALIAGGVVGGICAVIAYEAEKPLMFALAPMAALAAIGLTLLAWVPFGATTTTRTGRPDSHLSE